MSKTALLVIDMQKGLLKRPVVNKDNLIANINQVLNKFHQEQMIVILARHTNSSFLTKETDDWQLDSCLTLSQTDIIIDKTHSSIFKELAFIKLLKEKEIDSLVITGLVSNGCVQAACLDGVNLGFKVSLLSDAHSTWTKDAERIIQEWNTKLAVAGVKVIETEQFINSLS